MKTILSFEVKHSSPDEDLANQFVFTHLFFASLQRKIEGNILSKLSILGT